MPEAANNNASSEPERAVVETVNAAGRGPFVLACEHASNHVPAEFGNLGLASDILTTHVAWDPGAFAVARLLSEQLDAPLVASRISRLVYDCNRPPSDDTAMPARSEIYDVPGNAGLTPEQRRRRAEAFYFPFRQALRGAIERAERDHPAPVLVTIHSFTPVYFGRRRDTEIGILHDADSRFADLLLSAMAAAPGRWQVARNQPYGPHDGVTHTLREQAMPRGLFNVMIEIRNDLIATPDDQAAMAAYLAERLTDAFAAAAANARTHADKRPKGMSHA